MMMGLEIAITINDSGKHCVNLCFISERFCPAQWTVLLVSVVNVSFVAYFFNGHSWTLVGQNKQFEDVTLVAVFRPKIRLENISSLTFF